MSLSVEQVRQMREQIKANDAAKTAAQKKTTTQTAKTTPAAPAAKSAGTGLSVAQVAQIRSQMTAAPASTSRLQTTASTPAWTGGTRQVLGTVSADTLGKQVLADMASNTGSPVATDRQEDYEPGWNYVGSDNAPKQRAIAQGTYGSYAKAAQKVGNALAKDRQTDRFDELNQWMDADPRHREVVDLLRQKEYTTQEDKGVAPEQAVQVTGTKQRYSPGDLLKMGYTAQEINEARAYIREYDALPVTDRAVRRTADTTKGIAATVASAVPMAGEMTAQGVKDIRATQKNEAALDKELEGDARGKELKDRITAVDMDYNPQYTDEDLRGMGYSQSEIDEMRSRIAGTVQKTALDKDTSLGYQLYHYGQQRTEAAQAGMSPAAKTAMGVATSAAENLAVAGVSPYLVLPVLSAQGAAESMGQDAEKGTSAGQAVGVGLAKFGAGWAINSVGVADMARSMGVDYARDTVAGKLADLVRSSKLVSGLGNSQLAANTISGGVDNAVQAFVETYADKIIDATLGGDQQAADELLQSDTFLQALQSGLTGGASGALGGAVGTGLGAMSRTLDARAGTETAAPVQADTESRAADAAAAQRALEARAMEPGEAARQQADQAAAVQQTDNADAAETTAQKDAAPAVRSENPAVQQLAAAMEADALTGKTINLFTPNAANEANRAAFAEEYGMELPATASETRKALRTLAQQQTAGQAVQQAAEAPDTNVGNNATQMENPAADPGQSTVEKAGETVENGQGYSVSMSNDTMTVRFADGTEAVRTVDPENPRTMLFDPEQLHQQAQAESRAEVQQEAPAQQQSPAEADGLRRTAGLQQQTLTEKQREVQRVLTDWKVSEGAAETISRMVPDSVADLEHYTAAASSMYRMGQMDGVKTFDKALELAGGMNNLAPNTNYVLQQPGGEQALRAAFLQGQGEVEAGAVERGTLGGALTDQSTKGEGRVIWKGSDRAADDVAAQVIRLNAAGTGTDAILKSVLLGPDGSPSERVKAYVDTETGRIFFGDRNGDVFGTVLHEDYHWYNALDAEGAKAVQQHVMEYLAKSEGFENVDELIRNKLSDYAQQGLTYGEAAEELVADAWRGIFDSEESFKRWVEFQRGQAEKNAGRAGTIRKVMNAVKDLLSDIVSRAKEVLAKDPENRAALKAQRLAEAEKRALQEEYFAHAEKAMDALRAAKENAAALENKGAAKERRYEILRDENGESYVKIDEDILEGVPQENWKSVVKQAIKEKFPNGFVRNGWTILNSKDGRNEFVWSKSSKALQWENPTAYADKMRMAANLDEIIQTADEVYREPARHKNAEAFNRGKIKIQVGENAYKADVLTAIRPDTREIFYDLVNLAKTKIEPSGGTHEEPDGSRSRLPDGSKESIAQNDAPVKKNIRFQLAAPVEVDSQKDLVAVHNLTEQNLQEALELGGMPSPSIAVVKAQEGHTKYGPISLVFGSDTIDPMVDKANRVYGADAWTPTRPGVEYEVNYEAMRDFENRVYEASGEAFEGKFVNSAAVQRAGVDEASSLSREELAQKMQRDTGVQLAYLKDKGITVEPVYRMEQEQFDSIGNDALEAVIRRTGEAEIKEAFEGGDIDRLDKLADAAADALEEKYTHGALEGQNRRWMLRINKLRNENRGRLYQLLEHAYKMLTDTSAGKQTLDVEATRNAIREKAPEQKVEQWVYDKLEGVLGEKGIRNEKEPFTPSGKKRSFAQLHNPYTLENLVKAMNSQNARGQDVWGVSASTLMSTTTAEYKTLDEARADKGRLRQMPEAEYKKLLEDADGQIEQVIRMLRQETTPHSDNSFEEQEILGGILMQAAQGKRTAAAIGKAFAKEDYIISKDAAQRILKLYKDVAKIPTGYFEAKPQRAVGFDEVRAAILPDNASRSLIDELQQKGVKVELYKAGDDAQRTAVLNRVPDVRFQLAEQASREAKKNDQRQASRDIANTAAAMDTLSQFFGVARGVKVSQDSLDGLAARWTKANASRADRAKLANETRVLVDYLKADGADMTKAQALAETLAGEVLDGATYRNSELWDEYPELHRLEYTVNKTGKAKAELVKRYGNWSAAVAEARSHGVALRQADGVRDGNPAEQYESIVNDTRAVGGIQDGARALWKAAAQQAGVEGVMSMESTEWLDVLMNLHDSIKPEMRSRFADEAEYEDARVELAGRMIEDIMNVPEMTDAEAIFEGMQKQALQMAKAAAGDEARAAEVEKDMQGVQKVQRQEFARRLAANQRTETRSAVKIDGKTFTNLGDVNEYITYQREEFRRQLKQQEQRLKAQRQEDMDAAKLWYKERMGELREENDYLADQVKQEQRRADRAERSLMIQDNEIMEWEAENERRREAWQQKQAQRNAIALEVARQQRDEDIAVAKKVAENRVQRARDARKADELKRSIRANAAQLNQMVLRPQKGKYVQKGLIVEAAEVAKLANLVTLNSKAVNQLTRLQDSITASMGSEGAPNAMTEDWKQSKVPELIQTLREDLTAAKNARLDKLHEQLAQAEALPDSEKARALQDRLKARIRDTENRTYLPMTVDQLRLLKAITSSTLHVIRTENKTLSLAKAEEVSAIADAAAYEVKTSKGNRPGGRFDGLRNTLTKYQLDMLGGERVFRMLGGYAKNGQMEKLARMLNDGQRRQSEIIIKGEKLFADVTGKTHLKEMDAFAGPGAETVDIGLTDTKGNSVPLNHAMLCSLYMHLQNADSRQHLLNGGLTVPNMEQYTKGNIERAYQEDQTVHLGGLQNADGTPMVDTVLQTVENALTDYDRAWIADMQELFNRYTTNLINETSMQLLGYNRAGVKNYYPIAVDKSALATQIEGLNLDATIEGRGFLKNRVKKAVQPILLEECSNVVQRSIRDTAAYAGLALPIRDVQKVLNSNVETKDGVYNLKNGIIKEQWGRSAVEYVNDLLTDLQTKQRRRPSTANKVLDRLRGNYAGAILTLNPGVAIAQAASLPTAAAVLGSDTMASVVPFVKNFSPKQRAALETEISEHGDVLLEWRKRGSQRGELASIGKGLTPAEKAMDKLPKALTGWINGVDEVTVAALWEGSKAYVKNHPGEFAEGAAQEGSEDYWQAVNRMYQKVIEQTQPNYTVMQRAGIQRNPNEVLKQLTMFTTQRFQNYGILADAVMDYNAQKARYEQGQTEETQAELQRAGKQLRQAAGSQVAQTAVFALMKIGADFLLHRWDREQDENGDVTLKSLLNRFTGLFTESAAGNFLYGGEVYGLVDNALHGKNYDVLSVASITVVNNLAGDVDKFVSELRKDTADMDEAKLAAHHGKVEKYALTLMEDGLEIAGVPFGNGRKILEAFKGYVQDAENVASGGKFTFSSLPASATGQYDRLYDAYASGDTDEAQAAMEKLQEMGKEEEAYKQLKTRLVKYDDRVQQAAQAQVKSNDSQRQQLTRQVIRDLYEALGIREGAKADADKREAVIDCVTGAVNKRAGEVLKGDNDSVTDDLVAAVDSGRAQDVQEELDRLLRAGKSVTDLKSKITEVCKPEYLAGSEYDRQKLEEMLLALTDGDGNALYEQKTFATWLKNAEKAQTTTVNDPYADLR